MTRDPPPALSPEDGSVTTTSTGATAHAICSCSAKQGVARDRSRSPIGGPQWTSLKDVARHRGSLSLDQNSLMLRHKSELQGLGFGLAPSGENSGAI